MDNLFYAIFAENYFKGAVQILLITRKELIKVSKRPVL